MEGRPPKVARIIFFLYEYIFMLLWYLTITIWDYLHRGLAHHEDPRFRPYVPGPQPARHGDMLSRSCWHWFFEVSCPCSKQLAVKVEGQKIELVDGSRGKMPCFEVRALPSEPLLPMAIAKAQPWVQNDWLKKSQKKLFEPLERIWKDYICDFMDLVSTTGRLVIFCTKNIGIRKWHRKCRSEARLFLEILTVDGSWNDQKVWLFHVSLVYQGDILF